MARVSKHDALLATLAYADVFHYSLSQQELILWFLFYPVKNIPYKNKIKNTEQSDKWNIAERAGRWLSLIPTIQLVGVTGGLAMNNAGSEDDIDLFFIVSGGTLWISRMMATILMDLLGLRRHPGDIRVADKICLNMFMTEKSSGLSAADRDCFSAHEVLQMVPLWEQKGMYKKFLTANQWVRLYLPNAWNEKSAADVPKMYSSFPLVTLFFRLFEWPAKKFQLWYMARHRTCEVISDTMLRFHPRDARVWVKRKLQTRLRKVNIPLDKIFYAS